MEQGLKITPFPKTRRVLFIYKVTINLKAGFFLAEDPGIDCLASHQVHAKHKVSANFRLPSVEIKSTKALCQRMKDEEAKRKEEKDSPFQGSGVLVSQHISLLASRLCLGGEREDSESRPAQVNRHSRLDDLLEMEPSMAKVTCGVIPSERSF